VAKLDGVEQHSTYHNLVASRAYIRCASGEVQYHTVAKGDTMYGLSKRFGMTVDRLRELNGMADTNIKIGQQ
jgi:LysM domain